MDPFAGNNQDPQSLHKYLYCHANPVNGADPTGMEFKLSSLSISMMIAGLIVGVMGIGTWIYGYATNNDFVCTVGAEIFLIGLVLLGCVAGLALGILKTAAEAFALQVIISTMIVMINHGGSHEVGLIARHINTQNIIGNLAKSGFKVPSHGIIIFENRGGNLDLVNILDRGRFEWLNPPVKSYSINDRVLQFWISEKGSRLDYEIKDVVGINSSGQPNYDVVRTVENAEVSAREIYYEGFNWAAVPKKSE